MTETSDTNDEESDDNGITINIDTSDNETDTQESESVDNSDYDGSVELVGTVHVSKKTRDRVIDKINEVRPDVVSIELDRDRLYKMFERGADVVNGDGETQGEGFGIQDLIRQQQQKQFGGDEFLKPGEADMLPAVREGIENNSRVALMDMSVDQLKQNVKDNVYDDEGSLDLEILNKSFDEMVDSFKSVIRSQSNMAEKIKEGDGMSEVVKNLEEAPLDQVQERMEPLKQVAPEVVEALIDERDKYMAGRLHWLRKNGYRTVGVMGRGHMSGVQEYLNNPDTIPSEYVVEPDWYDYTKIKIN